MLPSSLLIGAILTLAFDVPGFAQSPPANPPATQPDAAGSAAIKIVSADFGDLDAGRDEIGTGSRELRKHTCDATGYFQMKCEYGEKDKAVVASPSSFCAVAVGKEVCNNYAPTESPAKLALVLIYRCVSKTGVTAAVNLRKWGGEKVYLKSD
jgi:hypothetical protein